MYVRFHSLTNSNFIHNGTIYKDCMLSMWQKYNELWEGLDASSWLSIQSTISVNHSQRDPMRGTWGGVHIFKVPKPDFSYYSGTTFSPVHATIFHSVGTNTHYLSSTSPFTLVNVVAFSFTIESTLTILYSLNMRIWNHFLEPVTHAIRVILSPRRA